MSVSASNRRLRRLRNERLSLLSDWYGPEFAASEIAGHISQPHLLSDGIRSLMAKLESPESRALRRLREMWPSVAGAWISQMAIPAEWRPDGVLILEVRHSALLRELRPSMELIRGEVNRQISDCVCSDIKLTIGGGTAKTPHSRCR
jgi:hypothetical protein